MNAELSQFSEVFKIKRFQFCVLRFLCAQFLSQQLFKSYASDNALFSENGSDQNHPTRHEIFLLDVEILISSVPKRWRSQGRGGLTSGIPHQNILLRMSPLR